MKKAFFLFLLFSILAVYGFAQNNLTPDQIRQYANELGVPYEALQRLVDSHRTQTGLTNPNANGAQLLSIQELGFMRESDMLNVNSYYRIQARFNNQSGRNVFFASLSNESFATIMVEVDFFVNNIQSLTVVDALIGVKADYAGKPRQLFLVEISKAK